MLAITDTEIKHRLAFDNPWWERKAVPEQFRAWPRRAFFNGFYKLLRQSAVNRAVILMGPRRVGKTVLLTQAIQDLIDEEVSPNRICYVSVDTPIYTGLTLEKLLRLFMDAHGHTRDENLYVMFDEIQYHADWERHLKSLVDSFPAIRFVASGSAAAALKMKSVESGAGRFTDFLLPPLNFAEFLRFRGLSDNIEIVNNRIRTSDLSSLNQAFVDYINFGGFPEAVLEPSVREEMDRYVANDIVDKVLLRDIPSLYGIPDTQELKKFFTVLAYNSGSEVSYESLSQASGVAKNTLRKYLEYLEAAFLIQRLHRLDENARRFKRVTHFKVYLTNPSIRSALFGPIDAESHAMGQMAETAVICQLAQSALAQDMFYARWKDGEVDLIILNKRDSAKTDAIELKWSDRAFTRPREELSSLIRFCSKMGRSTAWVYTKTKTGTQAIDGLTIHFDVLSGFCYVAAIRGVDEPLKDGLNPGTFSPFDDTKSAL